MRLHWYGLRYGDKYTTPEEVKAIIEQERKERAAEKEMRQRLALMSPEERAALLEEVRRANGNPDGQAGGTSVSGSA